MIKPLGNRILVDVIPPSQFSDTGRIVINDSAFLLNTLHRGRVVRKGLKVNNKLQLGDIVVFEGVYGRETNREDKQRVIDVGCLLGIEST